MLGGMTEDVAVNRDLDGPAIPQSLDPRTLAHPATVQVLASSIAFGAIALWPEPTERGALATLVAIAAIAIGGVQLVSIWHHWREHRFEFFLSVLFIVVGAAVLSGNTLLGRQLGSEEPLARIVAGLLIIDAIRRWWVHDPDTPRATILPAISIASGILIVMFPREMLGLLAALFSILAAGATLIVIAELNTLSPLDRVDREPRSLVAQWFDQRPMSNEERQTLHAKIFYEGATGWASTARFFALMGFAAAIAALGVIGDSTAVVIGAMLIAPLMTPLMGIALSLSMGWPHRLARSALIAGTGAGWAIVVGLFVGLLMGNYLDISTNSQIQSRIAPTVVDLLIAIAAGAAGAYGLSRSSVADALPGVAVAIALVPPLTVVGICYSQGAWSQGNGALLLFLTNAVSIMVVGSLMFVLTGQSSVHELTAGQQRIRTAVAAIAVMAAIVVAGIFLNGRQLVTKAITEGSIRSAVTTWASEANDYEVMSLSITSSQVEVTIIGPAGSTPPSSQELAQALQQRVSRTTNVVVHVVEANRQTSIAIPDSSS